MFAGTKFNWHDNSYFSDDNGIEELVVRPLFLAGFSADKGTEKMIRIHGDDFYSMYGTKSSLSFARHGQALLQAARIIDAGGELLCKRVVANDATLSNIILVANVSQSDTQRRDENGNLLYIDATSGETTTEAETVTSDITTTNSPLMIAGAKIKWTAQTVQNCKTYEEVKEAAEELFDAEAGVFPMYIVTDIGRSNDCKAIRISPDYTTSKGLGFMVYSMAEIEGAKTMESVTMTANPTVVFRDKSFAVNEYSMGQLTTGIVDGVFEALVENLSEITGLEAAMLKTVDVIFGCNIKGVTLSGITVDTTGVDLSAAYGIPLESGSIGTDFGTGAFYKSAKYTAALENFFDGEFDDAIFDVDVHKIYAVCDANYADSVKESITELANHREDFFFFRDLGLGLTTYDMIAIKIASYAKTKFAGDYMTTYQVIDPNTKKRIEVTMMYDLAPVAVGHFSKGPAVPFAGEINDVILSSAIEGTINYIPKQTKSVNQKELLDDLRVNYATYYEYGGKLVVESLYTSYDASSQLSYLNNVLAIQTVMRALRTNCPKNRFKFQTGNDFSDYEEACRNVLSNFKSYFYALRFAYTQDDLRAAQKIFYAAIEFEFNNWAQTEIFDLYAINTEIISSS